MPGDRRPTPGADPLDAGDVAAALGLDESYHEWLTDLETHPAGPELTPRPAAEVAELLGALGVSAQGVADAIATLPDARRDPARWWLLDRCHRRLVSTVGDPAAPLVRWPRLPAHLGDQGRCFALHWYAATVPFAREWHRRHGVPEAVSRATLADLGRHEAIHRRLHGTTGVDAAWWMTLHLRCLLFEIGPLQYEAALIGGGTSQPWYDEAEARAHGPGFTPGDPSIGVHIPSGVRLDPAECDASLLQMRALFHEVFPVRGRRLVTCSSWLLDDQLPELLTPTSNILAFQRGLRLVPGWSECDAAVLDFTFRKQGLAVERASATTSLQRAVLDHLAAGRHFRWRTGWRDP